MPLPRRTVLRGAGIAVALPFLDAMEPLVTRSAYGVESESDQPRRILAIQTNMGILPQHFFPSATGREFELTPYLEFLGKFKSRMTVFSGVSHPDVDGAHEAERSFLTAAPHPGSAGFRNSISLDQFVAEQVGSKTRFPSFVLDVNAESVQGMSFSRNGVKVPSESSPSKLYAKMFLQGNTGDIDARIADLQRGRSSLDFVSDDAKRLSKSVGASDRERIDQYFSAVRDYEKQLELGQEWERKPKPKTLAPAPSDVSENKKLIERIRLMLQIAKLAFESDSTRMVSLFINAFSVVPELPGVKDETHSITHHGGRPEALKQLYIIESAQFAALAEFLNELDQTKEHGAGLLDRTSVVYGTPMGNASSHDNKNLPVVLLGGGFKHAGHLAFDNKNNYPLSNLFLSILHRTGLQVDRFASSTGTMRGLEFDF